MRQRERKRAVEVQGQAEGAATPAEEAPAPSVHVAAASGQDAPEVQPPGPAPLVSEERLAAAIEAVLLTYDRPVTSARLAEALRLGPGDDGAGKPVSAPKRVERAIEALNGEYERTGRSFRIEHVAGGVRVMTLPEFAEAVAAFQAERTQSRLSRAAVETLAIIAYRQPITRAELEAIRGVACGEVIKTLLDRRLVEITGRAEELGRPMLYGTTRRFLEQFGLASLKDLPAVGDLTARAQD